MKQRSIWMRMRLALAGVAIAAIALPGFVRAGELRAPQNVNVRPTTAQRRSPR